MLKLSLIIPVYNEERHIKECLDSIVNQTVKPYEVIVVDNNCTDRTIEISKSYDFVKIVSETKQGRGHARNKGFNSASGEILGRIDADTRLDKDWVEKVVKYFETDDELQGITGLARTAILPYVNYPKAKVFSRAYFWYAHAGFRTITMWGANMAIRKIAWVSVSEEVCNDDSIVHEDEDISLEMASKGMKIRVKSDLLMTTNGQSYRYLPKLLHYINLYENTKRYHKQKGTFDSDLISKLGFWQTLPGRIYGLVFGALLLVTSVIPFPIDYLIVHSKYKHIITK